MRSEFEFKCPADPIDIYYTVTESIVQQLISQELSIIEGLICRKVAGHCYKLEEDLLNKVWMFIKEDEVGLDMCMIWMFDVTL